MTSYVLHNLLWRDLNWLNRISLNIRLVTQKVALGILSGNEFIYWPSASRFETVSKASETEIKEIKSVRFKLA